MDVGFRHSESESSPQLSSLGPATNGQHDDGPCHDERGKSHADCEDEHCHQVVGIQVMYNVAGLAGGVSTSL
jgi:hypothetical protein